MSLELINDPIEFARELSLGLEATTQYRPTREQLKDAVDVMNQYLWAVKGDIPATISSSKVYLDVPDYPEVQNVSDDALERSRIDDAIIKGKINSFMWLGSTGLEAFGIQMGGVNGVNIVAPYKIRANTAFLPVDAVEAQFAA